MTIIVNVNAKMGDSNVADLINTGTKFLDSTSGIFHEIYNSRDCISCNLPVVDQINKNPLVGPFTQSIQNVIRATEGAIKLPFSTASSTMSLTRRLANKGPSHFDIMLSNIQQETEIRRVEAHNEMMRKNREFTNYMVQTNADLNSRTEQIHAKMHAQTTANLDAFYKMDYDLHVYMEENRKLEERQRIMTLFQRKKELVKKHFPFTTIPDEDIKQEWFSTFFDDFLGTGWRTS